MLTSIEILTTDYQLYQEVKTIEIQRKLNALAYIEYKNTNDESQMGYQTNHNHHVNRSLFEKNEPTTALKKIITIKYTQDESGTSYVK